MEKCTTIENVVIIMCTTNNNNDDDDDETRRLKKIRAIGCSRGVNC